ncbi:MAG: hypothetical protein ACJ0S4_00120 [Candidatus Rariloculaceae bacterium]|tara:strand:- start:299 stop:667 length:369 start_codon:yes stop_codon:yes gene_type:complete
MKSFSIFTSLGIIAILAACTPAPPDNPVIGSWNFNFDTPQGPGEAVVTMEDDGTGLFASGLLGDVPLSNLTFDGASFSFSLEDTLAGVPIAFSGTVEEEGTSLSGEFDTPIGAIPVSATRVD